MVGATIYNRPDREALEKAQLEQAVLDSLNTEKSKKKSTVSQFVGTPVINTDTSLSDSVDHIKRIALYGPFSDAAKPQITEDISIETDLFKATISSKGGYINHLTLKEFVTWQKKPLDLIQSDSTNLSFSVVSGSLKIPTSELYFTPTDGKMSYSITGSDSVKFTLRAAGDQGEAIDYTYLVFGDAYKVNQTVQLIGLNPTGSKMSPIAFNWSQLAPRQEKNLENERNNSTIYYQDSEKEVDKINPLAAEKYVTEKNLSWIGFKQQFFTSVLISETPIQTGAELETRLSTTDSLTKSMHADFSISPGREKDVTLNFQWYFGPTHYATLQKSGHDLQKQIPLGWGIFGWVNKLIVIPAFNFLGQFNLGYGLVILLLTLYIKVLLLAFQFKSYMSQAKMRVLKPEMDELNEKYKNDEPMKKQQAVMELYRSAGVNPLGGCLPMLFQIPILFALFNFFPNAIELRQEGFLWADDLSTYDSILNLPFTIPFYGNHVSLFALMMTISTIIYTQMNNQLSAGSSQMMPQLKWMMYLMPVIFLFVLNSYAAGLNYYYFLANVITFGQQFAFRKLVDDKKIHAKIQENKKKPKKAKASSFQQRLEEMAKSKSVQPNKK